MRERKRYLLLFSKLSLILGTVACGSSSSSAPPSLAEQLSETKILSSEPADGSAEVNPQLAEIVVRFSAPVDALSVDPASFTVFQGSNQVAGQVEVGSLSVSARFIPSHPFQSNASYRISLNGVRDLEGRKIPAFLAGFRIRNESALSISRTRPLAGQNNVPLNSFIELYFSSPVSSASVNERSFRPLDSLGQDIPGAIELQQNQLARFVPQNPLQPLAQYSVRLSEEIEGENGAHLEPFEFQFHTTEIVPPSVVSVTPLEDAESIRIDSKVEFVFSEPIDEETLAGSFSLRDPAGNPLAGALSYNPSTRTGTFVPAERLEGLTEYTVTVNSQVLDLAGNRLSPEKIWHFTTQIPVCGNPVVLDNANNSRASGLQTAAGPEGKNIFAAWIQTSPGAAGKESVYTSRFVVTDSKTGAGFWGAPQLLEQDDVGPVLNLSLASTGGAAMVLWRQKTQGAAKVNLYYSLFDGQSWTSPALTELDDSSDVIDPKLCAVPSSSSEPASFFAVWRQGSSGKQILAKKYFAGAGWDVSPTLVNDGVTGVRSAPNLAASPSGDAIVVWSQGTSETVVFARNFDGPSQSWGPAVDISTATGAAGSAAPSQLAFDAFRNCIALFTKDTSLNKNSLFATRYASGTWAVPVLLEDSDTTSVTDARMAIDPAGNAYVVWQQRIDSLSFDIFLRTYDVSQELWDPSGPQLVEEEIGKAQNARIVVGSTGLVAIVWEQVLDSNNDGVVDSDDPLSIRVRYFDPLEGFGLKPCLLDPSDDHDSASSEVCADVSGNFFCVFVQDRQDAQGNHRYDVYGNQFQ